MAEETRIAWTDATLNPWMGCEKVSAGCANCYAETLTTNRMGLSVWGRNGRRQRTSPQNWKKPLKWNRDAERAGHSLRVFCASLCDVFEDHPQANAWRPDLWDLIRRTPNLDWQLLTKRPERIEDNLPPDWGAGWPHVWLGTSIEDERVIARADHLRSIPAVVHFVSYEPALGPLAHALDLSGLQWVIYGGESGPGFRAEDKQWARDIRSACALADVAFFHKQSAAIRTEMGIELDGEIARAWPLDRRKLAPAGVLV
jgi:protein gp37